MIFYHYNKGDKEMIRKILISLTLMLAVVLMPITLVGCKKTTVQKTSAADCPDELVGLYLFDTINLVYNGKNTKIIEMMKEEEETPAGWDRVNQENLHADKWFDMRLLFQLAKEECGVYLNKDGTIDFNIDENSNHHTEDEIDLSKYKDMLQDRTWFAKDGKVYVTGEFSLESTKEGPTKGDTHVFDNSVSISFDIVGKNLKTRILINYGYDSETETYAYTEDYTFILHRAAY